MASAVAARFCRTDRPARVRVKPEYIVPDWGAPSSVHAFATTRQGGVSVGAYAGLNLGTHVGDDPRAVAENRARLRAMLPSTPLWLSQVHGARVRVDTRVASDARVNAVADACVSRQAGRVCVVLSADCLPVLMCDEAGTVVAAAHAGWRGLAAGVLEATVAAMDVVPDRLQAWLGPAIGRDVYEVNADVRNAFVCRDLAAQAAFVSCADGKWFCDLGLLARQRLAALGIVSVFGGEHCTYKESARFYSYRRDGATGRIASLIWLGAS